MKTFFTLLLSTLFTLTSMAYDGTRLTVTSISNNKIFVEVDGRRFDLNGNTVSLSNIRPGVHTVRVLREMKKRKGFNIDIWSKREEVIYSIRATMKNGYHFDILVNRFGKVMIDERRIDFNDDWYDDADDDIYHGHDRNDRTYDDNNDSDYDRVNNDRNNRYDDNHNNYSREMGISEFNMAKESLRKEWFENSRLTMAHQIVDKNYFTSQQVKELLFLFTFENNRLDLAKYAYGNTIDKENYFIVNDAFTFNSNKDALARYIREFK